MKKICFLLLSFFLVSNDTFAQEMGIVKYEPAEKYSTNNLLIFSANRNLIGIFGAEKAKKINRKIGRFNIFNFLPSSGNAFAVSSDEGKILLGTATQFSPKNYDCVGSDLSQVVFLDYDCLKSYGPAQNFPVIESGYKICSGDICDNSCIQIKGLSLSSAGILKFTSVTGRIQKISLGEFLDGDEYSKQTVFVLPVEDALIGLAGSPVLNEWGEVIGVNCGRMVKEGKKFLFWEQKKYYLLISPL